MCRSFLIYFSSGDVAPGDYTGGHCFVKNRGVRNDWAGMPEAHLPTKCGRGVRHTSGKLLPKNQSYG